LDDEEDFRGYSKKDMVEEQKQEAVVDKVGNFLKESGVALKKKYETTDFKGGAKAAGEKLKNTFASIKDSEKTEKVKF